MQCLLSEINKYAPFPFPSKSLSSNDIRIFPFNDDYNIHSTSPSDMGYFFTAELFIKVVIMQCKELPEDRIIRYR